MSLLKRIEQGQGKPAQPGENNQSAPATPGAAPSASRLVNLQARRVAAPGVAPQKDTYLDLKTRVKNRLLAELDPSIDISRVNDVRSTIQDLFEQILTEEN